MMIATTRENEVITEICIIPNDSPEAEVTPALSVFGGVSEDNSGKTNKQTNSETIHKHLLGGSGAKQKSARKILKTRPFWIVKFFRTPLSPKENRSTPQKSI